VGRLKTTAKDARDERHSRALREPGWCPTVVRAAAQQRARAEHAKEQARVSFREYASNYLEWAKQHKRAWTTDRSCLTRILPFFGERILDEITTADVERFRDSLLDGQRAVSRATANRYRDLLSGMFRRAIRLGLLAVNPVKGVSKFREANQRVVWLAAEEEAAIRDALAPELRPLFAVSVHTGLRWSEQIGLRWRDVDMLAGILTVQRSKNGHTRRVPMNSVVRSVLVDLGSARERPDDPAEPVFRCRYSQADKFFPRAVERAQASLRSAGRDTNRLEGYTWHGNRHTFASRLVMAGVDARTVQELGGWRTLAMVARYSHLAPEHLHAAVERLVAQETVLN
jgi:integrase